MGDIKLISERFVLDVMIRRKCSREEAIEWLFDSERDIKEFQDRQTAPQDWRHFAQ